MGSKLNREDSLLLVVDLQEGLVNAVDQIDRVVSRSTFLTRIANLLEVPILATEQNPDRMGRTVSPVANELTTIFSKMEFSAMGSKECAAAIKQLGKLQVVLVGLETHICISQTALDLAAKGFEVFVCPDAVSARSLERHKLGMERLRDSSVMPVHTEAVAYEWLQTANDPQFREALKIVKEFA